MHLLNALLSSHSCTGLTSWYTYTPCYEHRRPWQRKLTKNRTTTSSYRNSGTNCSRKESVGQQKPWKARKTNNNNNSSSNKSTTWLADSRRMLSILLGHDPGERTGPPPSDTILEAKDGLGTQRFLKRVVDRRGSWRWSSSSVEVTTMLTPFCFHQFSFKVHKESKKCNSGRRREGCRSALAVENRHSPDNAETMTSTSAASRFSKSCTGEIASRERGCSSGEDALNLVF